MAEDHDDLRSLLADPAVWAEPSAELEDRVVAAIARERRGSGRSEGSVLRIPPARRPTGHLWRYVAGAAAAVALLVGTIAVLARGDDESTPSIEVALTATDLAPGAEGRATMSRTDSGWRIELDATGLDRLADGRFYEAWLMDADGVAVPIGTFNEGNDVTLWAGVSPSEFRTFSITEERADDGDPASSGRRVLTGTIDG